MTPCRNCNKGRSEHVIEYEYYETSEGFVYLPEWDVCKCCDGDWEHCKNCEREFPNSVEEVQTKDYSWD